MRLDVLKLARPPDTAVGPASTVDPSRNVTAPSVTASPALVVTVAANPTGCAVNDGLGDAVTIVRVVLATVTTAVAWLVAPCGSLTVSTTVVCPIGYGPAGDCAMVSGSPSASDEPLSIEASAVPVGPDGTVTSFTTAIGTWLGVHRPAQAPATVSVYCVPMPKPGSISCTLTTKVCTPPARLNE